MEDCYTFTKLKFVGEGRRRIPKNNNKNNGNNRINENNPVKNKENSLSLLILPETVSKPSFDRSSYILTPRGHICKGFFSAKVPTILEQASYIPYFPEHFRNLVANFIYLNNREYSLLQIKRISDAILDSILDIPCHLPICWGLLYNRKYRRVFEFFSLEKWKGLGELLKSKGYALQNKRKILYLMDPDHPVDLEIEKKKKKKTPKLSKRKVKTELSESVIKTVQTNATESNSTTPTIPTVQLPNIPNINFPPAYSFINSPLPSVPREPRRQDSSIYASCVSESEGDRAPKFNPNSLSRHVVDSINRIYNYDYEIVDSVIDVLSKLPYELPLRWGVIFNKLMRIRRFNPTGILKSDMETPLQKWKQVKQLLKDNGIVTEKNMCVYFINKSQL